MLQTILPKSCHCSRSQHLMCQEGGAFAGRTRRRDRLDRSGRQLNQCCSLQLGLETRYIGLQVGRGLPAGPERTGPQPLKRACTNLVEVAHDSRQPLVMEVRLWSCNAGPRRVDPDLIQSAVIFCRGRPAALVNTVHGDDGELFSWRLREKQGCGKADAGMGGKTKKRRQEDGCSRGERQLAHDGWFERAQG